MEVFLLIVRLVLAAIFAVAGFSKIADRAGSEKAAEDFGLPAGLAKPVAYLLPPIELAIAAALLFVQFSWYGAVGAALLLASFTAAMLIQIGKGNAPDCHCFGQIHSEPVGTASVVRNVGLLILGGMLLVNGRGSQGISFLNSSLEAIVLASGIAVVVMLAFILSHIRNISEQQVELLERLRNADLTAGEPGQVERDHLAHPHEGLPIGAIFPDFRMPDLDGEMVSLASVRSAGLPVLFVFIGPQCTPCNSLLPEFEQWQDDLAGKVTLLFISTGTADENLKKFGIGHGLNILLQDERELAEQVQAKWTPTALLMDAGGRVASHVMAGDGAIRALVDKIKSRTPDNEITFFTNGNGSSLPIKIGQNVPSFSATDVRGRTIDSDYFKGRQTLVTFWGQGCPYCQQMLEDLRTWDKGRRPGDPALVVFTDGDPEQGMLMDLDSPVIVEDGYRTAGRLGMHGTPSAVLVDKDGRIITETAVGAPGVWSLIGKR